jgi:hypothetical protein
MDQIERPKEGRELVKSAFKTDQPRWEGGSWVYYGFHQDDRGQIQPKRSRRLIV